MDPFSENHRGQTLSDCTIIRRRPTTRAAIDVLYYVLQECLKQRKFPFICPAVPLAQSHISAEIAAAERRVIST